MFEYGYSPRLAALDFDQNLPDVRLRRGLWEGVVNLTRGDSWWLERQVRREHPMGEEYVGLISVSVAEDDRRGEREVGELALRMQ
jgi:hypothetical protein